MQAIYFIVETLIGLFEGLLLLRLLMQLTRADFRNPIGRAIVQLTDPLVRPLRRVLPPVGKTDSASVVAIIVVSAAKIWILHLLVVFALPSPLFVVRAVAFDLLHLLLKTYLISIILNALLSFVAPGNYSPAQSILASLCNPLLNPVRRLIPSPQGIDLSPLWVTLLIGALLRII